MAATARAAASSASPRLIPKGYAAESLTRAACSSASRRSAASRGPPARRRSQAVERRSLSPSLRSAVRMRRIGRGRAKAQATATARNATGTPYAAIRHTCSMGRSLAATTTTKTHPTATTEAWSR